MSKKNKTLPGCISGFLGNNSYIIVFVAIFIVYAFTTNGLTWSGMMNVFRHSAVIGIIGLGMGLICLTGEIDLSVGSMLALDGGISMSGGKGKCLGILFGAMSYTIIDKIIVSLKMDSLINNAIKGIILLIVIMVQIVGPKVKGKLLAHHS